MKDIWSIYTTQIAHHVLQARSLQGSIQVSPCIGELLLIQTLTAKELPMQNIPSKSLQVSVVPQAEMTALHRILGGTSACVS